MLLINIGCGTVFHPAWVNIDANPSDASVRRWDIRRGLPFNDGDVDVCYASHALEHLSQSAARKFLCECHRVLRPGGIIRLAVPNLEAIARHYVELLDRADRGDPGAEADYDWIMLELYDQTVRSKSGGEMARYLSNPNISNKGFVRSRIGMEGQESGQYMRLTGHERFLDRAKSLSARKIGVRLGRTFVESLVRLTGGSGLRDAFREGVFRNSGEIHKWMYDRFSLRRILEQCGFVTIKACSAEESRISGFSTYSLDVADGQVRKPDSLFMEALKPRV